MKTAVRQMIQRINRDALGKNYSYEEVLAMLIECEIVQDTQIKIAYLHGAINVLQKTEVKGEEYFYNQFENSI